MTNEQIKTVGQTIAQETTIGGNTAARVGGVVEGIGAALDNKDAAIGYFLGTISGGSIYVNAPNYLLASGGNLKIKMPAAATSACTLTIGNAQAVQLWYNGAAVSSSNTWDAGEIVSVYYDGTRFMASNSQGGAKFSGGQKVSDVTLEQTLGSGVNSVISQKGVSDAVFNEIDINDIDDLKNLADALNPSSSLKPTYYTVTAVRGSVVMKVGSMAVISDNMGHVVTEIMSTHYLLDTDGYLTDEHDDAEVFTIFRSVKGNGGTLPTPVGTWTAWKYINQSVWPDVASVEQRLLAMMGYYVCDTAAGTAAKAVSASGYTITNGGCIRIKMTNANTADNVTLNINSTGAKALYYDGAQASAANTWDAGEVLEVYYDGTQYQCASGGGGKFATGEKVKDVGITSELDNSHNLIESAPINAMLNDTLLLSEWIQGTLNNHEYSYIDTRIISCAVVTGAITYNIAQGFAISIHEYSGFYTDVHELSNSTYIKMTTSWLEGSGTYTPDAATNTLAILISKTPTSSGAVILPSDSSNLVLGYANPMTLDNMRAMLNEHGREIVFLNEAVTIQEENELAFVEGTLSNTHKYGIPSSSEAAYKKRIIATMSTPQQLTVTMSSGYYCSIHEYSEYFPNPVSINDGSSWLGNTHPWFTGTLQIEPLTSSKTIVFILGKGSSQDQTITPIEGVNASVVSVSSVKRDIEINSEEIDTINGVLYGTDGELITETVALEQGGMEADGKKSGPISTKRIRTVDFVKTNGEFALNLTNGVLYNIFYYSDASESSYVKQLNAWHSETPFIDTWRGYIRLGIKNQSETNITPSATTLTITYTAINNGLIPRVDALDYAGSDSYVWGVDMVKKKARTIKVGTLTYLQAFCKYDGKYYSTNGSNVAEQDSSFTLLRDVSCNVGHGNSFQLVGNGKAWASGWDDQKMYRVDLATLTVDQTITLPTIGYTTCAVDDDNGLMYIFQRDTNPNYIGQYTFIVYNYVNEQILRTRKIESFAAMQSVDYYQGKILIVFGLGTQTAPSGMRIYNTAGDVLASFDLEIFRTDEPEGIMFTRDTFEILVSNVGKELFRIE